MEQGEPPLRGPASPRRSQPVSCKRSRGPGCRPRASSDLTWDPGGGRLAALGLSPPPRLQDDAPPEAGVTAVLDLCCPSEPCGLAVFCLASLFLIIFYWLPWVLAAAMRSSVFTVLCAVWFLTRRDPGTLCWELSLSPGPAAKSWSPPLNGPTLGSMCCSHRLRKFLMRFE